MQLHFLQRTWPQGLIPSLQRQQNLVTLQIEVDVLCFFFFHRRFHLLHCHLMKVMEASYHLEMRLVEIAVVLEHLAPQKMVEGID